MNRRDLQALTLVGLNRENPILDPLSDNISTTDYEWSQFHNLFFIILKIEPVLITVEKVLICLVGKQLYSIAVLQKSIWLLLTFKN